MEPRPLSSFFTSWYVLEVFEVTKHFGPTALFTRPSRTPDLGELSLSRQALSWRNLVPEGLSDLRLSQWSQWLQMENQQIHGFVSDWAKKKCTDFEIPEIHRLSRVINRCNRNNMNELKKWQITTCVGPLLHPTTPLSCCLRNAKGETSTVLLKAVPDQNLWRRPKMSRICHSLQAHL